MIGRPAKSASLRDTARLAPGYEVDPSETTGLGAYVPDDDGSAERDRTVSRQRGRRQTALRLAGAGRG